MRVIELGPLDGGGWLIESLILNRRERVENDTDVKPLFSRWIVDEGMVVMKLSATPKWQTEVMTQVLKQNSAGLESMYREYVPVYDTWFTNSADTQISATEVAKAV